MVNWLLKQLMKLIVGSNVFGQIQNAVEEISNDTTLTGAQKREKVAEKAKTIGVNLEQSAINLAIESAVTLIKQQKK